MPPLIISGTATSSNGVATGITGRLDRNRITSAGALTPTQVQIPLPSGVGVVAAQGSSVLYGNRAYTVGCYTDNLMVDEFFRAHRQGILAPDIVPTLSAATGPGRTGDCRVAIRFRDELTGEISPLSAASDEVSLSDEAATTGNIPTTCDDPRVSHVDVLVSMDGAEFRVATTRQLGVSSITENVATLALGEAEPETFERLPRGTMNAIYHDRQCIAGDAQNPDVLYVSAIGFPERYEGLSFRTRNGEPITSIVSVRDILLVLCPHAAYALRGYTEDDMSLQLIDGGPGAINHACTKVVFGNALIASEEGPVMFNGAFHPLSIGRASEWAHLFASDPVAFETAFAVVSPQDQTYSIYFNFTVFDPTAYYYLPSADFDGDDTVAWVIDYTGLVPELAGSVRQPDSFLDVVARRSLCGATLALPGAKRADAFVGSDDGKVRQYSDASEDDSNDLNDKVGLLRTAHYLFGDAGGDVCEGKTLLRLWLYLTTENQASRLYAQGGDEYVAQGVLPNNEALFWKTTIAGSYLEDSDERPYVPLSVHPLAPSKVSGRGFTFTVVVVSPDDAWILAGLGGTFGPGPAARPLARTTIEE